MQEQTPKTFVGQRQFHANFEAKKPAPQPPMPKANEYSIYAVKVYLDRTGYRRAHLKSIVRTQTRSEIMPAMQDALKDHLKETGAWIASIDVRKLECDFFIYDTKNLFKNK